MGESRPATLARISAALGVGLSYTGSPAAGQGRTGFAVTPSGVEVVVKWAGDPRWADHLDTAVAIHARLAARGYPTFETVAAGLVPGLGAAWVQTRVAGSPASAGLAGRLLDDVMAAVELQAGADPSDIYAGWSWVDACVFDDEAGWWRAARERGAGQLCDRVAAWVAETEQPLPGEDYHTLDLNLSNILVDGGRLSGIIDLDNVGAGDRVVDVAWLAFAHAQPDVLARPGSRDTITRLVAHARGLGGEARWRRAVAYGAVAHLGWTGEFGHRVPLRDTAGATELLLGA